jgi:RNA polymerase sigma-70 factor, ECF subfamily
VISEQDLLVQARQFETRALAEIYDLYSPRLYRYASRLLGDTCTAEDCVADTFNRFLQALRAGRGPKDHLQAYLFRTAHNLIVDHYRNQSPAINLEDEMSDFEDIEASAGRNIRLRRVRNAILELTADQQQVIALKFLEGWKNEEIARVLKKPLGAVKSLQHRALARLQKILLEDEEEA